MLNICRLAILVIVGVALSGCAAVSGLPRDEVPKRGRFTVVAADTGEITVMSVGLMVFSNVTHRVTIANSLSENMRVAVVDKLSSQPDLEYVHSDLDLDWKPPQFAISSYDRSMSVVRDEDTEAREAKLTSDLAKLAGELDLDLVLVLQEWGSSDYADSTTQPLIGKGIYFRDSLGFRRTYVYNAYRIALFAPKVESYRSIRGLDHKKLDKSRWQKIDPDTPPELESARSFLADLESIVPPGALYEDLCHLGVLPIQPGASSCSQSYPSECEPSMWNACKR